MTVDLYEWTPHETNTQPRKRKVEQILPVETSGLQLHQPEAVGAGLVPVGASVAEALSVVA